MMFLIHWGYALANISAGLLIYIYIGQTNPGVTKGMYSIRISNVIDWLG